MKGENRISPLCIGNLTAKVPVIQGGMGIGVSLGGLAGAVAGSGGVGIISAAQIGFREPDFARNPLEANQRAMEKEYKKARQISPDGVIGFNIMVAMNHYKEYVQKAAKCGADLIISGAGLPMELPEYVKGFQTRIAPIVSGERAARILLKLWDKKYKRTADLVVVEGPKAGGHLGFTAEEATCITDAKYEETIKKIICVVREYAEKYERKIPVVVAGGIYDGQDVKRMIELGADGVQVASRFVATKECDADIHFKEAYLNCREEDIVLVSSPVGMPGRAIRNAFTKSIAEGKKEKVTKCYGCLKKCNPSEIPYCITRALIRAVKGDTEHGLVFCGAESYRSRTLETVQDVVDSLIKFDIL